MVLAPLILHFTLTFHKDVSAVLDFIPGFETDSVKAFMLFVYSP